MTMLAAPCALAEDLKDCLTVHLQSGSKATYVLEETPVVTFIGDNLHIESSTLSNDHKLNDVVKFTFDKTSGIEAVQAGDYRITVLAGIVRLEGFTPGANATVCDIQGRNMASAIVGANGDAEISLANLSNGIYILSTTDGKTLKIYKK